MDEKLIRIEQLKYKATTSTQLAQRFANHYFAQVYRTAGLVWNSDTENEINLMVQEIIIAALALAMVEMMEKKEPTP